MANCVIHPIPLWVSPAPLTKHTYNFNWGKESLVTGYVWYIEGMKERVIVDAGGDPEYLLKIRGIPAYYIQTLEAGLDKVGLSVSDIDLIIQTHLHHDHVSLGSKYPKARVLVQKKELEFARNPHPLYDFLYPKQFIDGLNYEVIDGNVQISEGVSVLLTPGHTPGSQSVSVKSDQGTAIITGFCSLKENFESPDSPIGKLSIPVTPPHLHTNVLDAYDSVLRVKEMADIILPLHDPEFLHRSTVP